MLFRKAIEPSCAYCARGGTINEDQVICTRQGVVPAVYHCRHFRYDPLRRVPPAPAVLDFSEYAEVDFTLGEDPESGLETSANAGEDSPEPAGAEPYDSL